MELQRSDVAQLVVGRETRALEVGKFVVSCLVRRSEENCGKYDARNNLRSRRHNAKPLILTLT
jgi:hypothetical protein